MSSKHTSAGRKAAARAEKEAAELRELMDIEIDVHDSLVRRVTTYTEKKCATCKKVKPLSQFYPHNRASDGVHRECMACSEKRGTWQGSPRVNWGNGRDKQKATAKEQTVEHLNGNGNGKSIEIGRPVPALEPVLEPVAAPEPLPVLAPEPAPAPVVAAMLQVVTVQESKPKKAAPYDMLTLFGLAATEISKEERRRLIHLLQALDADLGTE